ncbi:UNVERIFIED_CONTAM: hypothetical protein GTU68_041697 [Idotea baltica]|nr:hypothetical protein [Idotea baltica]
MPSQERELSS